MVLVVEDDVFVQDRCKLGERGDPDNSEPPTIRKMESIIRDVALAMASSLCRAGAARLKLLCFERAAVAQALSTKMSGVIARTIASQRSPPSAHLLQIDYTARKSGSPGGSPVVCERLPAQNHANRT